MLFYLFLISFALLFFTYFRKKVDKIYEYKEFKETEEFKKSQQIIYDYMISNIHLLFFSLISILIFISVPIVFIAMFIRLVLVQ